MRASSEQRVLVVDDESAMNEYIADILKPAGFKVIAATDGEGALEAVKSSAPDVVILDIFMPKKDGLEVLIELRHRRARVPVLIISGKQALLSDSSMGLAKQLGANEILSKPFTPAQLVSCVTRLAEGRGEELPVYPGGDETSFLTLRRCFEVVKSCFRRSGRE